jgi:ABC-type polysaccharide/polyol phosphate export permease
MSASVTRPKGWGGDYLFLLVNLIFKDFRIRYRNMSLGIFWSLLNPLIMMAVLTFVFTVLFPNPDNPHFALFVLCGLIPFNFFTLAWASGTSSIVESAPLIKKVDIPREIVTLASVLSNCTHLMIQLALLLFVALVNGKYPNRFWLLLPVIWLLVILFVCGLSLFTGALNVLIKDVRYVVDSMNTILFWLVPIFYSFAIVPPAYRSLYEFNPLAAMVLAMRRIILEASAPPNTLLVKLTAASLLTFALGWLFFHRYERRFSDHL